MGVLKRLERILKGKLTSHDWESLSGDGESPQSEEVRETEGRRWAFKVLEVQEGASMEDIRKAYLRLTRHYHPDNFLGQAEKLKVANDLMSKINKAYELLTP